VSSCAVATRALWLAAAGISVLAFASEPVRSPGAGSKASPPHRNSVSGGAVPAADPNSITLNFVNAEIEGVVKAVSEITGKNFVLDPRVKGTVNIVSAKPISRTLVYDVFLSALRLQGYAAIEERGAIKIVPESEAKTHPGAALGPKDKPRAAGDQIMTQVFALKYESAAQLVPVLRPLIAPNNTITAYQATNTLVITDYASNLRRMERIIDSIDQPSGTDPIVIPLRHASAVDVAYTINRLYSEAPRSAGGVAPAEHSQRVTVVADARSNSLIARSDNPSRLARLRSLVATLDAPTSAAGNIHVVYLKNAEAVKVAETLRAIYLADAAGSRPGASASIGASVTAMSVAAGAKPPGAAAPVPAQSVQAMIQADPATNAIIINAPDAIYNNLRAALEKLDVRRAQVYVEALIAEITADKAAEFGIQWQDLSGANTSGTRAFGGTNFGGSGQNIIGTAQSPLAAGRGLNIGVVRGRVSIPGVGEILNLGVLVRALETDSNANILSTPTLLTLDNEEAKIVIGQNVPFITGQYTLPGAGTAVTPFQTIERRDVGLTLRFRPQISEGGTVRLQIYQEVSSVQDTTNPAGVITNKRTIESTVLVEDGQIIVIGGLIQDSVNDGVEKVPGLGDIPLLGNLFQYRTRGRSKTNLMVFLRPVVLRDARRADPLTSDRYDYILGEQGRIKPAPSPPLPDVGSPSLPSRQPPQPAEAAPRE
jgi:general secretion pathway protein D